MNKSYECLFHELQKELRKSEKICINVRGIPTKSLMSPLSIAVEKSKWHQLLLLDHFNNELLPCYYNIYELLSCCHVYIPQNI